MVAEDDMTAGLEEANRLVDSDETRAKGLAILRSAVSKAPERVDAAYYLAWALLVRSSTTAAELAEGEPILATIVQNTENVKPAVSGDPTVEMRARAFALSWPLPPHCVHASEMELAEYARMAEEAQALRRTISTVAAVRAVQMGKVWARAGRVPIVV